MDCSTCGEKDIEQVRVNPCSCHINPPCSSCTDAPYVCKKCGEEFELDLSYTPMTPEQKQTQKEIAQQYTPKTLADLDRSKIDYIRGNGGRTYTVLKGYCPKGTSKDDILTHLRIKDRPCLAEFSSFESGGYWSLSYFTD